MDTQVVTEGPLAAWSEALSAELVRLGYTRRTAASHMSLVRGLSKWMEQRQVGAADITPGLLEEFFKSVRRQGGWFQPTVRTLSWLLDYLRQQGVSIPTMPPSPQSRQKELLDRYPALFGRRERYHGERRRPLHPNGAAIRGRTL